jgi:plastocyanin
MTEDTADRRLITRAIIMAAGAVLAAIVIAAVALAACGSDGSSLEDDPIVESTSLENSVSVVDNDFEPRRLRVPVGASVTWSFDGDLPHNVTAEDGEFESDTVTSGEFTWTFEAAGDYAYTCTVHPGMDGEILVGDVDDATSETP